MKCETKRPTNCAPERTAAELRSVVSSFFSEGRWDNFDMNSVLAEDWKGERKQGKKEAGREKGRLAEDWKGCRL